MTTRVQPLEVLSSEHGAPREVAILGREGALLAQAFTEGALVTLRELACSGSESFSKVDVKEATDLL